MDDVKDTLRRFILDTFLPGEAPENLHDDTPLLTSGIIDSLAALALASFVEDRFDISLDVYDMNVERFDRIDDIAATVIQKQARVLLGRR